MNERPTLLGIALFRSYRDSQRFATHRQGWRLGTHWIGKSQI